MKRYTLTSCLLVLSTILNAQEVFGVWDKSESPLIIGQLVSQRFIDVPHPNFNGNPAPPNEITYPETCAWFGALRFAALTKDTILSEKLEQRFLPIFGSEHRLQPKPDHVDHTVFGTIPLQLFQITGNKVYYEMGLWYADEQWRMPFNSKREEYQELLDNGLSWQTRYWIDDMYMISAIQSQAFVVTNDSNYINRAAFEMVSYLDKIQKANGLFYHAEDAPFFWGRGNGWMAAGMCELLGLLPESNIYRSRILKSYHQMMKTLCLYQKDDGLWGQLVDDPTTWSETSGSAMFTYAMIRGVRKGWLDKSIFVPVIRKAWKALISHINEYGDIDSVCEGTNKTNDRLFYLNRKTLVGNMHGQAPVLWCVNAFIE